MTYFAGMHLLRRNEGTVIVNRDELAGYIKWYIQIRWYILATLATTGIVTEFFALGPQGFNSWNLLIAACALIVNMLLLLLAQRRHTSYRSLYWLAFAQIIFDILLASYLVGFYGGGQSRALILYAVPIVISGALFGRLATYFSAIASSVAYSSILILHYAGTIRPQVMPRQAERQENILVPLLFYTSVFMILAMISDFLSKRIQKREKELAHQEMISLASHQIRTPMTAVKSTLSTLMETNAGTLTPEQKELIRQAYQENEYELELIDNMMALARLESGEVRFQPQETDVLALIDDVATNWQAAIAARQQTLTISKPSTAITHTLDSSQIAAALDNLLSNASKYTPAGGAIRLSAEKDAATLLLTVADTGTGISQNDQKNLFTKYFRSTQAVKDNIPGSGLGLYFVKRIVETHQGTIDVSSQPGSGTIFSISLPGTE